MQKKRIAWMDTIPCETMKNVPSPLAAAVDLIYLLNCSVEDPPSVYTSDDNVLWVYYANSCFVCEDFFSNYGLHMAISKIAVYGGTDGFEGGDLSAEFLDKGKSVRFQKKNVSGTDFELIRDIALKLSLESHEYTCAFQKLIHHIQAQNSYLAIDRTAFHDEILETFPKRSGDTYYQYRILGNETSHYLNALSISQRKKLWLLFLNDHFSPLEFDDAYTAMEQNIISAFPWELALRLAMEEIGITVRFENGYFITKRDGSRMFPDFSSEQAAEKLFLKLIFPRHPIQ